MGRPTFNEAHLMEALASKTALSRVESLQFIGLFTEAIIGALAQGETVTLSNFGTLKAAADAGRGRGKRYVSFRAGRRLKRALNPEPIEGQSDEDLVPDAGGASADPSAEQPLPG